MPEFTSRCDFGVKSGRRILRIASCRNSTCVVERHFHLAGANPARRRVRSITVEIQKVLGHVRIQTHIGLAALANRMARTVRAIETKRGCSGLPRLTGRRAVAGAVGMSEEIKEEVFQWSAAA